MTALIIAEHDNAHLNALTCNAVTAALACADDVHVLVIGHQARPVAEQAARLSGVSKVLLADAPHLQEQLAENAAFQVLTLADNYSHLLFPATTCGKSIAPRVAASLDVAQVSEISAVHDPDTFDRPIYAGSVIATVKSLDPIKVLTVRCTSFAACADTGGDALIEEIDAAADSGLSQFVNREVSKSDRPELAAATIIVSGGRALGSAEKFQATLLPLAEKLGAALGASRAAVDSGFAANDLQVGQTGKIVAPDLYIACGISGAIQHLAGMKDSKVIVAINKDPDAPIFAVADYGLEADIFTAIPQLLEALNAQ